MIKLMHNMSHIICDQVDFGTPVPSGNVGVSSLGNVTVKIFMGQNMAMISNAG